MAETTVGASPNLAPLPARLAQLENELAAKRRQLTRSTRLTAIIGVVLLVALSCYFYYGYKQITAIATPDALVSFAFIHIDEEIPKARQEVAKEVKMNAPSLAKDLSKQLLKSLPDLRQQLEDFIMSQLQVSINESSLVSQENFAKFLKENRPTLEKAYKELASNEQLSDATLAEMQKELDRELQDSLHDQARTLLLTLKSFANHLERLRTAKTLSAEEQAEKRLAMVVKRLHKEQIDPAMKEAFPAPDGPKEPRSTPPFPKKEKGIPKKL